MAPEKKSNIQRDIDKYVKQLQNNIENLKNTIKELENSPDKLIIVDLNTKVEENFKINEANSLKLLETEGNLREILQEKDQFLEDIITKDETIEKMTVEIAELKKGHEAFLSSHKTEDQDLVKNYKIEIENLKK